MKASVVRAVALAAVAGAAGSAQAQSAQGTASVTLVYPAVQVANTRGLSFGTVTLNNSAATVTVPSGSGSVSQTGGVTVSGEPISAQFSIAGQSTNTVTVTLPTTTTLTDTSGSDTLLVDNFTLSGPGSQQSGSGQYSVSSPQGSTIFVAVGGRLSINANSPAGDYSGTFTVTVNNN